MRRISLVALSAIALHVTGACTPSEPTDTGTIDTGTADTGTIDTGSTETAPDTGSNDTAPDADVLVDTNGPSDAAADGAADDTQTGADTEDPDADDDDDDADADTGSADISVEDVDDVDPVGDGLPFGPLPTLTEVLEYLEGDPEGAVRQIANTRGWPMPISSGTLFVNLDMSLPYIAGDFGGWEPTPMTAADGFLWSSLVDVRLGQRYKFTDRERYVADPWSRTLDWDEFGDMSRTAPETAHIERYFGLTDDVVTPRNLHVWVPAEPVTHVLYAHDGQNLFGPGSMFGSWRMEQVAPAGMLIVGVFNTADRFDDYTPVTDQVSRTEVGGGADDYLRFLDTTVRPLIRTTYGESGPVGILGSSLGGVVSLYAVVAQPGEWDFAASLSGALSWGSRAQSNETLHARAEELAASGAVIYLDSGGGAEGCVDSDADGVMDDDPAEADDYCVTIQLRDQLVDAGLVFSDTLWHWWEPGALHNEAAWAQRVERPLAVFADMASP
jgi:hypothetical protein